MAILQNKKKALFIVEGKNPDRSLIKNLTARSNIAMEIFSVCANIHMLYGKLKSENFYYNILDALLDMPTVSEQDKNMLRKQESFAFTYLIFDLDLQHYDVSKRENVVRGINDVKEMVRHFCDETDPTIGKLYINYPMVESFRDCTSFFDEGYKDVVISLYDITKYKNIVSNRGLALSLSKYSYQNFCDLIRQNLYKGYFLQCGQWLKPTYQEYSDWLSQSKILDAEEKQILSKNLIFVLNTSYFVLVDYFGNKNSFYDNL